MKKFKKELVVLLCFVLLMGDVFTFTQTKTTLSHSGVSIIMSLGTSHSGSSSASRATSLSESINSDANDSTNSDYSEGISDNVSVGIINSNDFTDIDEQKLTKVEKIMVKKIDNSLIYRHYQYDLSLLTDSILDKLIENNIKINVVNNIKDTNKDNTIGLYYIEDKYIDIEGKNYNKGCILHEVGHAIDYGLLNNYSKSSDVTLYSSTNKYKNIWNKEKDIMTTDEYHNTKIGEYFAESFIYYFMSNDYKTKCPKSYNYIQSIIK